MATATKAPPASRAFRCLGLASSCVGGGICCCGSTVVGAVARPITASVVWGRMLVSISVAKDAEPRLAVPASLLSGEESPTRGVPSTRQKPSALSVSIRLHVGQRFIGSASRVFRLLFPSGNYRSFILLWNANFLYDLLKARVVAQRIGA